MKLLISLLICQLSFSGLAVTHEEEAVAAVLMGEAACDGQNGMIAVAEVIHQRAVEKKEAPYQIISAGHGHSHVFSCLNGTTVDQLIGKFNREPAYQQALVLATATCQNPRQLPGLAKCANHYARYDSYPYWAQGRQPVAVVGRHVFYHLDHY